MQKLQGNDNQDHCNPRNRDKNCFCMFRNYHLNYEDFNSCHSLHGTTCLIYSGAGLNIAAYGSLLAGAECGQGKYPVTVALLDLMKALVQPLHKAGRLDDLMPYVIFLGREIYPSFHKWRYQRIHTREHIGLFCRALHAPSSYHPFQFSSLQVRNAWKSSIRFSTSWLQPKLMGSEFFWRHEIADQLIVCDFRPGVRDVCVYTLLYTESGRTLLNIIGTGVDAIEKAIASQGRCDHVTLILLHCL